MPFNALHIELYSSKRNAALKNGMWQLLQVLYIAVWFQSAFLGLVNLSNSRIHSNVKIELLSGMQQLGLSFNYTSKVSQDLT